MHICGVSRAQFCQHEGNQSTPPETLLKQEHQHIYSSAAGKTAQSLAQFCQHEGNQGTPAQASTSGKTAVLAQALNNSMYEKDYAIVARKMSQKLVGN